MEKVMKLLTWLYSKEYMMELVNWKGRWNRKKYILYPLAYIIPAYIVVILLTSISTTLGAIVAIPAYIAMIFIGACSAIKRTKDLDKNPWMVLILFVPILGLVMSVYLIFFKGTTGKNQFGPDPLKGAAKSKVEL